MCDHVVVAGDESKLALESASIGQADTLPPLRPSGSPDRVAHDEGGRYSIGAEVARGAMGSIRRAEDLRLGRTVALKELLGDAPDRAARFEREALVTARLQHPAIVPVYDAGKLHDGRPFYAMKLVGGRSLDQEIRACASLGERLALLPRVATVVDAIAYAHSEGVLHRDLKPHNVMVGAFGETLVIDWGLARATDAVDIEGDAAAASDDAALTQAGAVMGTPAYMPPEQAAGARVDARADVYALGAILYHVLAGRPPYAESKSGRVLAAVMAEPPASLSQIEPGIPEELCTIVGRAMARAPAARYASAGELAADLRRFQAGQLVGAHRYTRWQLLRRFAVRHPVAALLGVVVLAGALIGAASFTSRQRDRAAALREKHVADTEIAAMEARLDGLAPGPRADALDRIEARSLQAGRAADQLRTLGAEVPPLSPGDALTPRIHAVLRRLDADTYSIPPAFRDRVARFMERFRPQLAEVRGRKAALWPVITAEVAALGLPPDLAYLTWPESALQVDAESPTGAAGLWQFSAATAKAYGLSLSPVDERLDPARSSRAAARFLADLLAEFGEGATLLAVASYNMGPEAVRAALRASAGEPGAWRGGRRGFWHLYRRGRLTAEARGYVPLFIGALLLDEEP